MQAEVQTYPKQFKYVLFIYNKEIKWLNVSYFHSYNLRLYNIVYKPVWNISDLSLRFRKL